MGKIPTPVVEPTVSAINRCKWENFRVTAYIKRYKV